MGNKNKIIKAINSQEGDIKTKMKKNKIKYEAKDSEITVDISEASKKTKSLKNLDRNKNKELKNKRCLVSNDTELDSSFHGELENDNTDSVNDLDKIIVTNKKNKKRKQEKEEEITNVASPKSKKIKTSELDITVIEKKKNKKRKLEKEDEINNVAVPIHKKIKASDQELRKQGKSKKETNETKGASASIEKSVTTNKRKFLNEDEAEVKDEDIDKFCDELSEEDNNTYENWVKLFEANFKKNKNPS